MDHFHDREMHTQITDLPHDVLTMVARSAAPTDRDNLGCSSSIGQRARLSAVTTASSAQQLGMDKKSIVDPVAARQNITTVILSVAADGLPEVPLLGLATLRPGHLQVHTFQADTGAVSDSTLASVHLAFPHLFKLRLGGSASAVTDVSLLPAGITEVSAPGSQLVAGWHRIIVS